MNKEVISRSPTHNQYKIRILTWNHIGSVYGISIPRGIAKRNLNTKFTPIQMGENILLVSGMNLAQLKKEIDYDLEVEYGEKS